MNKFLLFLSITFLIGCSGKQKKSPSIYFAGEIVNPKNDSVVLYKDDARICSSKLDSHNRFVIKLDASAEEGLYHFGHSPEVQYVYLEKGDSLLIRVNTADFDESLVFEGIGQEINNFLLEMFLVQENEERDFIQNIYQLNPEDFSKKVDSINVIKLDLLHNLEQEAVLSENAVAIAKTNINYTTYLYKERYPFKHREIYKKNSFEELPSSFYDYRKELTFNNPNFTYIAPYYNFMKEHFYGVSYMNCKKDCKKNGVNYVNQLHFNEHQLKLIDSAVGEKNLKDNLIRFVALKYLLRSNVSYKKNTEFIEKFHEVANDNKHVTEINTLYNSINNLQPNMPVPAVWVVDFNGNQVSLAEISTTRKDVVFYFWMGEHNKHFKHIINRVNSLNNTKKNKYTYIGISLRTDEQKWKDVVTSNNLNTENQFRAAELKEINNALIINGKINRAVVTSNGNITNAFADIYSSF
tara:strand:+ start:3999 stop:5396 length:1398 start_codon:yes stop_codon:yes gene_type:complete